MNDELKLTPYDDWLTLVGVSRATGWRYRKDGWITTVNLAGRLYVSQKDIEHFFRRLEAGEFARHHGRRLPGPRRTRKSNLIVDLTKRLLHSS